MVVFGWILFLVSLVQPWIWLRVYRRRRWDEFRKWLPGVLISIGCCVGMSVCFSNARIDYLGSVCLFLSCLTAVDLTIVAMQARKDFEWPSGTLLTIAGILLFFALIVHYNEDQIIKASRAAKYAERVSVRYEEELEGEIPIYGTDSDMMVSGSTTGRGRRHHFVIGGSVDSTPVYKYRARNELGALVSRYVPSDERISMIFDVLGEGEQPYLKIIKVIEITTDGNVEPATVVSKLHEMHYHFYVPKESVATELLF